MSKKYVVTGGAGFIGSHLVHALVVSGCEVVVIDNLFAGRKNLVHPYAEFRALDICSSPGSLQSAFRGADGVFHLAAWPRVPASFEKPGLTAEVNVAGTANVLDAAHKAEVKRVVFASSSSVYGNQSVLPLVETMAPNPMSPYAVHKLAGEYLCRVMAQNHGPQAISLRFFNVYGSDMDLSGKYALAIGRFLKQRKAGEPLTIYGDGEQTRDFTHVADVVRACMLAMGSWRHFTGEVCNIGAGHPTSINRIAELIGGPVVHQRPRLSEPRHTHADTIMAEVLLDWEPVVAIENGIAELKRSFGIA